MPKILIDFQHPRGTVKMVKLDNGETWALHGECNRCGTCCEKLKMTVPEHRGKDGTCNKLEYEIQNGEPISKCTIVCGRPSFCVFYPRDPHDPLFEECSFKWELLSG